MINQNKNNRILRCFLLIILLVVTSRVIIALPNPAAEFYGIAIINITANISAGVNISAYDPDSVLCGNFIVSAEGYYGLLSCNGDDTETAVDEGAESGDSITFYVNGSMAVTDGNVTWESGVFHEVNLTGGNIAPTFGHNLTNQEVNESSTLVYDVNCSDANGDDITYYDNTTEFNIDIDTGIFSWTPANDDTGINDVTITCSDNITNTTGVLRITVYDINNPPVLGSIGSLIAVEGTLFVYDVNATDADNDTLAYSSNSSLFTLNSSTGVFSFTPTLSQVGNYSVNFSVSDGNLNDSETVSFRIVRGPYCGDSSCGSAEDCSSCSQDCGACPAGTGTGAGAGTAAEEAEEGAVVGRFTVCHENWKCSDWPACSVDGFQKRKCVDINQCGTKKKKPTEIQVCEYIPTCSDDIQNGDEEGVDCGGICNPCITLPSCSDRIQNQNENGVDCGGPCEPCEITKFAKLPELTKLAPFARQFPWMLLALAVILLSSTYIGDKAYVRRLTKKEIEEYRAKIKKYKRIRKGVYTASSFLAFAALVLTFYMYLLSNKTELMVKLIWIPCLLVLVPPAVTLFIIRHFKYYEYKKREKEKQFLLTHKREKRNLIKMEDDILSALEVKIANKIKEHSKNKIFDDDLGKEMDDVLKLLSSLVEDRKIKMEPSKADENTKNLIMELSNNSELLELSKEYPEFKSVLNTLKALAEGFKKKEEKIEDREGYLVNMVDIAADNHLISVAKSRESWVKLYNQLVEAYENFKAQFDSIKEKEEELVKTEALFSKKINEITKNPQVIENIKANTKYASLYNSLVDLFNHYKKRQELFDSIKEMERSKQ